jgi:hypothetical protein
MTGMGEVIRGGEVTKSNRKGRQRAATDRC